MVQPSLGLLQSSPVRPHRPGQADPSEAANGHNKHGDDRRGIPVLAGGQADQEGESVPAECDHPGSTKHHGDSSTNDDPNVTQKKARFHGPDEDG